MAAQAEAPKVIQYVATGSDGDEAAAAKVVLYLIIQPNEGPDGSNRQGHVHTQIITRAT